MKFRVIDKQTSKEADPYEIALHEEWASCLVYCDMEGFAITEDGYLVLMDECGSVVYCDTDRFKVVFEDERPHGECRTCKHFVRGGLDGKTYVCEHPKIELDDYYDYSCLMVEETDFCSSYEKKEGESN